MDPHVSFMRIGVASGKKQHYYELVRELERRGDLAFFWNALCFPDGIEERSRLVGAASRLVRRRWPRKHETYRLEGVDAARVGVEPWSQLLGAAIHAAMRRRGWGNVVHNALFDRWVAASLARRARDLRLDLFHVCCSHALHSGRAAQRAGLPVLLDQGAAHRGFELDLVEPDRRRVGQPGRGRAVELQVRKMDRELALGDHLVVPSAYSARTFVERGFPADRIFVAPYGVDVAAFRDAAERARAAHDDPTRGVFRVLFIGGDQVRKGVPFLLDAMNRLALPDAELVLVAPHAEPIMPLLRAATCRLRHIPFLSLREVADLIPTCSVFCLPSLSDGFGMVVTEAMAAGLPAIVTTNVGAEVEDGVEGYVVPIRDADALADRLAALHADPDLRARMGRAAAARAARATWAHYADTVEAMYRAILGPEGSTP